MSNTIEKVLEFMMIGGQETPNEPIMPSYELNKFRYDLVAEEALEGLKSKNLIDLADALGDLEIVLKGWWLASGLSIHKKAIIEEIHNSNMSKFCLTEDEAQKSIDYLSKSNPDELYYYDKVGDKFVIYRESDNKIMKGLNYFKPDLSFVENNSHERYAPVSICSDGDGHKFIIPQELVKEFYKLLEEDEDKFIDKFSNFMCGGECKKQLYIKLK